MKVESVEADTYPKKIEALERAVESMVEQFCPCTHRENWCFGEAYCALKAQIGSGADAYIKVYECVACKSREAPRPTMKKCGGR